MSDEDKGETFGALLEKYRKQIGWSQTMLASKAKISKGTLNSWETYDETKRVTNLEALVRLAKALNLSRFEASQLFLKGANLATSELKKEIQQSEKYRLVQNKLLEDLAEIDKRVERPKGPPVAFTAVSTPFNVPRSTQQFIGRESILEQVKKGLRNRGAICVLSGMSGLGKTAVAEEVGHQMRQSFTAGVLWLNLSSCVRGGQIVESAILNQLDTIAQGFGLKLRPNETLTTQADRIRQLLSGKKALLILDNAYSYLDTQYFLPSVGAKTSVLITTQADQFPIERAQQIDIGRLQTEEAAQFLSHYLGEARVAQDRLGVDALIDYVEGHTLSLSVIGGALKAFAGVLTIQEYLREIQDKQTLLDNLTDWQGVAPSVRATFMATLLRLDEQTQAVFVALATFQGYSFTDRAIQAMFPELGLLPFRVCLDKLQKRSLLQKNETNGRFYLHGLLRVFVRELQTDHQAKRSLLLNYFERFIAEQKEQDYQAIGRDWPNIEPLISDLAEADDQRFAKIVSDLTWRHLGTHGFMEAQGHWREGRAYLAQIKREDESLEAASWLFKQGRFAQKLGDQTAAYADYQRCLDLLKRLDNQKSEPFVILHSHLCANMAKLLVNQGQLEEPYTLTVEAEEMIQQFDSLEARIAHGLLKLRQGVILARSGETQRGQRLLQDSLDILPHLDSAVRLDVLNTLGITANILGQPELAMQYWEDGLSVARKEGFAEQEANLLLNLSTRYAYLGDFQRSIGYVQQALSRHERIKNKERVGMAYSNLSHDYFESKIDLDRGEAAAHKALAIGEEHGFPAVTTLALNNLAKYQIARLDWDGAQALLQKSIQLGQATQNSESLWESHRLWSECLAQTTDPVAALNYLRDRLPSAAEDPLNYGIGCRSLGIWWHQIGQIEKGYQRLQQSEQALQSFAWELAKTSAKIDELKAESQSD